MNKVKKQFVYNDSVSDGFLIYKITKENKEEIANFLVLISRNMKSIKNILMHNREKYILIVFSMNNYNSILSNKIKQVGNILYEKYNNIFFIIHIQNTKGNQYESFSSFDRR